MLMRTPILSNYNQLMQKRRTIAMLKYSNADYVGIELCAYSYFLKEEIKGQFINNNLLEKIKQMIIDMMIGLQSNSHHITFEVDYSKSDNKVEYAVVYNIDEIELKSIGITLIF